MLRTTPVQPIDHKAQAVQCWTLAPCGPAVSDSEPGTRRYFETLVAERRAYAPWMAKALDYATTRDLDVLDVGCGQGMDLYEYASCGARVVGIDLTPRHVELAQAHLASMGIEPAVHVDDAESLHFPEGAFDRVSSNGVLHHTPDIAAAFDECRRVLRPGGRFTTILYNKHSFHYWTTQVLEYGLLQGRLFKVDGMQGVLSTTVEAGAQMGARPLVRVYTPQQVRKLLKASGFERVVVYKQHFRWGDVPLTTRLPAPPKSWLNALGSVGGWYLVGIGWKGE